MLADCLRGAEVSHRHLADLDYSGCLGCMSCRKKSEICVLQDGISTLLREEIPAADVLVIAAPVYLDYVSGQAKLFMDRFFAYLSPEYFRQTDPNKKPVNSRLPEGKTGVFILTQGQPEGRYGYITEMMETFLRKMGFTYRHYLRGCLLNSSRDIQARPDLREQAGALARLLNERYP
jgi:multimeric flavodoxin WrbA